MLGLGDVWKAKLNVEEARKKYLEAIELQPNLPQGFFKLACTYYHSPERQEYLRKALECNSQYYDAVLELALDLIHVVSWNFEEAEKLEEVVALMESAAQISPRNLKKDFHKIVCALNPFSEMNRSDVLLNRLAIMLRICKLQNLKSLFAQELAKIDHLILGPLKAIQDYAFHFITDCATAATKISFQGNESVLEESLCKWLLAHTTPLRELTVVDCPQFGDALLLNLSTSIHRTSLDTLALVGAANVTKEGLLQFFKHFWPSLTTLNVSNLPALDLEVLSTIVQGCPELTDFRFPPGNQLDDSILEHLPAQLKQLHLAGRITSPPLKEMFSQRCTALTHVSLQNIETISFEESFFLSSMLPSLVWFKFPSGQVHLWTGNTSQTIKFDKSLSLFSMQDQQSTKKILSVTKGMQATTLREQDIQIDIQGPLAGIQRIVKQGKEQLFSVLNSGNMNWRFDWKNLKPTEKLINSVMMIGFQKKDMTFSPALVRVNGQPFQTVIYLQIEPHQNITLICTAFSSVYIM